MQLFFDIFMAIFIMRGGYLLSLITMLILTFKKTTKIKVIKYTIIALLFTSLQGGIWYLLSDISRSRFNREADSRVILITAVFFIIYLAWGIVLFIKRKEWGSIHE
jgi:hypothetical protein